MQTQIQIPVDVLVRQLQQIPGIEVSIKYTSDTLFKTCARTWLETYKKGIVKDNTYQSTYYEPVELHLIPYFGEMGINSIHAEDVQVFFKTLIDKFALETQKKIKNALRQIYEMAMEEHICFESPVRRSLRLVSHIPPIEKHTWSSEECAKAIQFALHHKNGLSVIALLETALSRSELLGLTWDDLNVDARAFTLQNGLVYQKSTKTGHYGLVHEGLKNDYRKREIPISPLLSALLALKPRTISFGGNHRTGKAPKTVQTKFVFHSPSGAPYDPNNWYVRVLKRFMRDLHEACPEVPILTTHELRHTRATLLKDEGVDLFSIARLLGHCDLNMLAKRYAHDNIETLRRALGLNNIQV